MKLAGSLDTNVLLRLLLKDDKRQHEAVVSLVANTKSQFLIADAVIVEIVFVLIKHYGYGRRQVNEVVGSLIALPVLNCSRLLLKEALTLFSAHPQLSFEDCYLAAYAKTASAEPLYTFDKKLAKQAPHTKLMA